MNTNMNSANIMSLMASRSDYGSMRTAGMASPSDVCTNGDTISVISDVTDNSTTSNDSEGEINSVFENKIQKMSVDELKEKCKENGMSGLSKLKKQDFIQLLLTEFNNIWVILKNATLPDLREIYKTHKIKEKKSTGNTKKSVINNIMNYNSKCETLLFIKSIKYQDDVIEKEQPLKEDVLKDRQLKEEELLKEQQLKEQQLKEELIKEQQLKEEQLREEDKTKKKKTIPKNVKINIWNTYIDSNIQRHKCLCCKKSIISITEFHVGHVISEHNGGTLEINNLRPICASCNYSMGTNNMVDYIVKYGYYI
jgi:5-methylcytosine-specific restriction endonuclease McrA